MNNLVLLIDDEQRNERPLRQAMSELVPEVRLQWEQTANGGLKALKAGLADREARLLLVLLDVDLPDLPGHEVLRSLRSWPEGGAVPVVVASRSQRDLDVWLSYKVGANAYIVKPDDPDTHLALMKQVVAFWCKANSTLCRVDPL